MGVKGREVKGGAWGGKMSMGREKEWKMHPSLVPTG